LFVFSTKTIAAPVTGSVPTFNILEIDSHQKKSACANTQVRPSSVYGEPQAVCSNYLIRWLSPSCFSLLSQCHTPTTPLLCHCPTTAQLLLHHHFTPTLRQYFSLTSPLLLHYFTITSPLLHRCFTVASPLLRHYFPLRCACCHPPSALRTLRLQFFVASLHLAVCVKLGGARTLVHTCRFSNLLVGSEFESVTTTPYAALLSCWCRCLLHIQLDTATTVQVRRPCGGCT
jgi:hypothetical protein